MFLNPFLIISIINYFFSPFSILFSDTLLELSFDNLTGTVEYLSEFADSNISKHVKSGAVTDDLFVDDAKKDYEGEIQKSNTSNIEDIQNSPQVIYVPLPLPLASIKSIIFSSKALKDKFITEITSISNIPLIDLTFNIETKLFNSTSKLTIEEIKRPPIPPIDYSLVYSYGGLLTMLFYNAKNGELSNRLFHSICELNAVNEKIDENIRWVFEYFSIDKSAQENVLDLHKKLFDSLKNSKNGKEANEKLFHSLNNYDEPKHKKRTDELISTLIDFEQLKTKETSAYFTSAKTLLEKWLLMLFFKGSSEDLIEYSSSNNSIRFTEEEYLLFSMIFGIRDKFISLPKELREIQGLQRFISLKMASYAHKLRRSSIQILIKKQDEPLTLIDMFEKKEFKILFSKQHKIDCLTSTLKLPKGSKTEHNKDSVVYFNGNLHDYVELSIDDDKFYKTLLKKIVSKEDYNKYLAQYKKT